MFPDAFDIEAVRACRSIGQFDDAYIAKIYGFVDRFDYYRQTGSKWFLPLIRVPSISINAIDDPFVEERTLPTANDIFPGTVRVIYHANGGHCGFVGDRWSLPQSLFASSSSHKGWLPQELARIIDSFRSTLARADIK